MAADSISANQDNNCWWKIHSFTGLTTLSPLFFNQSSETLILSYSLFNFSVKYTLILSFHFIKI